MLLSKQAREKTDKFKVEIQTKMTWVIIQALWENTGGNFVKEFSLKLWQPSRIK